MLRLLSHSGGRRTAVLVAAVAGFVWLYETRTLDSRWQAIRGDTSAPDAGQRLEFEATAYCKGTTTASGVGVRTGIAAADPKLLPVGSVVNIATGDPNYNGVYTVMDTGPKVQGRVLDLYMWSCKEALRFGRKHVAVTVLRLGWNPQASSPRLIDRLFRKREAARRAPGPEPPPPAAMAPAVLEADQEPDFPTPTP
jgi:3D (Asp-Asp-Asp) domain-containing protein